MTLRAVIAAMGMFGLFGVMQMSSPGQAAETAGYTTAPLATVAPLRPVLALDQSVALGDDDFTAPAAEDTAPPTLAALVEAQATADTIDAEQECLAVSVYYEAKGEPLAGQLAVAETVLNRAVSGRFPSSLCGVVRQPGQFSFVRGGQMPAPPRDARAWKQAVAIARIAAAELWRDVAPNALYFHAARVRPGWGSAKRIAQFGNHVFYR